MKQNTEPTKIFLGKFR